MSDITTSGIERLVGQPSGPDAPTVELARRVENAVRAGVSVEFFHRDGDQMPAFRMRLGHGALQVADGRGRHLGTFASGAAAMRCGWERSRARPLRTGKKQP